MLFSNETVAGFVSKHFEPCWEMVRPVPIVRIDFGNGTVITRTLHGNIASYVCTADGRVLDVVPGIYNATGYVDALDQLRILADAHRGLNPDQAVGYMENYHQTRTAALKNGAVPPRLMDPRLLKLSVGKGAIELPIEHVLAAKRVGAIPGQQVIRGQQAAAAAEPKLETPEDVASWKALADDTTLNEKVRRLQIHEYLAKHKDAKPETMKKWLYKDVLHADLDDPYLGLGTLLFANYPFAKEDKVGK